MAKKATRRVLIVGIILVIGFRYIFRHESPQECQSLHFNENSAKNLTQLTSNDNVVSAAVSQYEKRHESSIRDLFSGYEKLDQKDLENNLIPNHVYYMWCYNRTIEFRQYLSILSTWKIFRPDDITLFTKYNIKGFQDHYNAWLPELLQTIPSFRVETLPPSAENDEKGCGLSVAIHILHSGGGIYFADDFFPLKSFRFILKNDFSVGVMTNTTNVSFLSSSRHNERLKSFNKLKEESQINPKLVAGLHYCDILNNVNKTPSTSELCIHLRNVKPVQLMHLNTTFGRLARTVLYGQPDLIQPKPLLPGKIPKIFHLVWYGRKLMDIMMYLSLSSILGVVQPEAVYIHGDGQLYGKYFEELKKDSRVKLINRELPTHIFEHQLMYTQHRSDIIRADVLLKYGGIYCDWDVLWLNPIDDLIGKGYDSILNLDHMPRPGFPDSINLGVLMSKPGAHFIKHWQDSLVNYKSRDFFYNAIELPYKVYEKHPDTVHIEPRLQVMCYYLKCHPVFHPQFRNYNEAQPFNWTTDVYSIHFTFPDPPEYANMTSLKAGKGMFADIAKFILNKKL